MKSIIKKTIAAVMLVFAASGAWAATPTPTAVWQTGEFMRQKNGYSITLNGNAINKDGNIVIKSDASAGVTIDVTDVLGNAGRDMSVLIKYSNATAPASQAVFACVLNDNNGIYDTGLGTSGANAGTLVGYYNSSFPYTLNNSGSNVWPNPASAGSGYLLYSYKHDTKNGVTKGVYAYNGSAISNMSGGSNNGLCWPNRRLHKIAIGGPSGSANTSFSVWPNLVIEKIAIFVGSVYTNTQMSEYTFPTEVQVITVNSNTSVSAINNQLDDENYDYIAVLAADGITIDVDQAFDKIISVACEGSVTLSANSQPDASYFSGVDFTGVQGGLLRSWLTPGVVGFNFNANGGRNAQGNTDGAANTALALEIGTWYKDAYSASGSSTAMFSDGLSLLSWKANNVYAETTNLTSGTFIQGYLDDGGNVSITLTGVPYETYDIIIYCSTDDSTKSFKAKRVNGTIYTWDSTAGETTTTSSATTTWGLASAAAGKAVYGANTLRINNLTGPLSIKGGTNGNGARGCISAIQIMPAGTSTAPEMTVGTAGQTTQATWTGATWNVASAPTSGNVIINVSGNVELTVDETVALSAITVTGEGSLKIIPDQQNSVTLTASSISSAVPLIFANDGIGIDTISASVTYLYKTTSIASSSYGNTYTAGVGAQGSSVSISHNGGSVTLQGATYYLSESCNGTATTVTFHNATAEYASNCGVGMATYVVEGSSSISAERLILSQGDNGRTAAMTVKDTASINVTGTSDVDSNQASIMFGHWNGPSTFTIQDNATFTAASQVLVGKTSNNHTINIDGGTFTAKGIKTAEYASGTNTLNLNGGLLVLGDVGITSYSTSTTIGVNVLDDSEIRASAATLPITQSLTVSEDTTLSFTKDSGIVATAVSLTGAVSGYGNISVGPGVTLNLGTNRPAGEISVDEDGVLTVVMTNKGDVPVLKVSSEPSNVILYDTDGTTEISDATVVYDDTEGTITVMPPMPRWTTQSNSGSFDTAANWSTDSVPTSGDVVIELSQDTTISISETYTLSSLTITGTGTATLSGTGTITAGTVYVVNGAALTQDGHINATSISLDSGTVLKLNGVTESAVISGAGAVETYGTVVLAAANSMTGGITVKSGSSLSTSVEPVWENPTTKAKCSTGFGPYNKDSACSAQSRVVVEDGGCVDINNVANKDAGVALTISGKGILNGGVYSGAVKYSGSDARGNNKRQISSLSLAADAMVDIGPGCGLVHSDHSAASLALNGHTLTMRGTETVPMVNVTANAGTLVMDGAILQLSDTASNFTGVNVVAKGCATLNMSVAPTAIGSLTLKPTASGTTASAWNLPAGLVPVIDASNIDPSGLSYGANLTLFTAPNQTELTDANISVIAGSRYTTAISGNTVTATVKSGCPTNFMHYDFNAANSIASDSTYNIGNLNPVFVETRNGKAGTFDSSSKPYYDSNTSSKSPFYAGEMTITTLLKPIEANNTILWNFGGASGSGIALIAKDSSTLALVSWTGGTDGTDVVSVSEDAGLLNNWHLVTIVANSRGTTLYVDNKSASVSTVLPADISGQGQFGSIHGAAKNYTAVSGSGFLLDDWRVYDAALTASEIETIKVELVAVTLTVPNVANTTVSVTVGGVEQVGVDGDGVKTYSVSYGSAVVVTYAAASGCRISGTTTYNIASATENSTIAVDANLHSDPLVARITGSEIDYTLQEAVTASSVGDTIMLLDNCAETAVDTTGKDFIFNENGYAFSGTWTGSGCIVLTTAPSATAWSSSRFVADGWAGSFVMNWTPSYDSTPKNTAWVLDNYGVSGSTVVIAQAIEHGYLKDQSSATAPSIAPAVYLKANLTVDNGFCNKTTTFSQLGADEGVVFTTRSSGDGTPYAVTLLKDFAGSFNLLYGSRLTIDTIERDALPSVGDLVVSATAQTGSSTPASFNVASTKIRVGGVDTVVPLAYSTSVAVDESGLYKAVAQISTTYYATMQEAITVAGDNNLASITVLDDSAALPAGYYLSGTAGSKTLTRCAARSGEEGSYVYYNDVYAILAALNAQRDLVLTVLDGKGAEYESDLKAMFFPTLTYNSTDQTLYIVVAKIGETGYRSFDAAIDAASSGQTIQLISSSKETITLDKTIILSGASFFRGTFTGTGKVTLDALMQQTIVAAGWSGTIVLPAVTGALNLAYYGVSGSTVELTSMSGYFKHTGSTYSFNIAPNIKISGSCTVLTEATSGLYYSFQTISGTGTLTLNNNANSISVAKVSDFSGSIVNNSAAALTIARLELSAAPTAGQCVLTTGGTGTVNVSSVYVGNTQQDVILEKKTDGIYVAATAETETVGEDTVTVLDTGSNTAVDASSLSGKVAIPGTVAQITGVTANDLLLKVEYNNGSAQTAYYGGILSVDSSGNVSLDGTKSVTVGEESIKVKPEIRTGADTEPMTLDGDTPGFTVKTIPGLYYSAETCSTPDGTFTSASTPQQATTASTIIETSGDMGEATVKYYRIKVSTTGND